MGLLFKNNAETTLSSGINNSVTTVPVTSAAVFPTPNANNVFFATIDDGSNVEVVKVTGISSNDLTVVRAQDNTSAAAFGSGAKIELRLTAKILETGTTSLTDLDGDTAIFIEQVDDEDKIRFDTAGLQRLLIDPSGNITTPNGDNGLGLGTVTVPHGGVGAAKLAIEGSDSNFGAGPHVQMTTTGDDYPLMQILPYAHDNVAISFDAYHDGTTWKSSDAGSNFQIYKLSDALHFYYNSGVAQGSSAQPWSSGAYLSATSGYWGIGTGLAMNANTDIVFTDGTWTGEKARKIQAHSGHIYYQSASHIFRNASGTNNFQIDGTNCIATGNITAYGSISDERLKENIEVIENPIDKIKDLKGVTFNYKKDGSKSTGLIAQDLEKVLPEAVYTSKTIGDEINDEEAEEHLAIRYGNTVGLLVEAIKEQQEQIETLTAKVKELEDKE